MKKLQLFIVILGFLCYSNVFAAVFPVIPSTSNDFSDLGCSIHGAPLPVESNITDATLPNSNFNPDFGFHSNISGNVGTEDINLNIIFDDTDSTDDFEMNDHDVPLTSPTLKKIPASIVRPITLNTFNFPPEVSRLRI